MARGQAAAPSPSLGMPGYRAGRERGHRQHAGDLVAPSRRRSTPPGGLLDNASIACARVMRGQELHREAVILRSRSTATARVPCARRRTKSGLRLPSSLARPPSSGGCTDRTMSASRTISIGSECSGRLFSAASASLTATPAPDCRWIAARAWPACPRPRGPSRPAARR